MVSENYFDHTSPAGETPLARIKASTYLPRRSAYMVGENIALGTMQLATPASIVASWMKSPDHRANILNPDFRDSGIGIVAQAPSSTPVASAARPTPSSSASSPTASARAASQITSIGVPTEIRCQSRVMSALRRRMQPCDGRPGMSPGSSVPWMPTTPPPGQSVSFGAYALVPRA